VEADGVTSWQSVLELSVEARIAAPVANTGWNYDKWGTGTWAAYPGDWTPIECDELLSLTFGLSRSSLADNYGASQLTMTVRNAGGWASGNPRPGQLTIIPGIPIRVQCRPIGGTWRTIWNGEVDHLTTRWDTGGAVLTTITAADALAQLAVVDPPESAVPQENVRARLARIATLAERTQLTFLEMGNAGTGVLQAGTIAQQLVTEAILAVNSTTSVMGASPSTVDRIDYIDAGMTSRPFGTNPAASPFWITNQPNPGGTITVCPLSLESDGPDVATVANEVNVARAGGTVQTRRSTKSIAKYDKRTWGRTDLLNWADGDAASVASRHLQYRAWPRPRYTATYHVPDSFVRGTLAEWLRWASHPLAAAEQNICSVACIPARLWWDAGTNPAHPDDRWLIDVACGIVGVTHAITPEAWVTSIEVDEPGDPETTELDTDVEVPELEEVNA
jgi:hypothetical protein